MNEITNIYKTPEWTAVIITDDGIVMDVDIQLNPTYLAHMERAERRAWLAYKRRTSGRRATNEDDTQMLALVEGVTS